MDATAPTTIVWLCNDFRLADHAALRAAGARGKVLPVYVHSDDVVEVVPGAASRWWLHHSLASLQAALGERGLPLVIRRGDALATLRALIAESGATAVYWHQRYTPGLRARDLRIAEALQEAGIEAQAFAGALLHDPDVVRTGTGGPYTVFTPFWKKVAPELKPKPDANGLLDASHAPATVPESLPLDALELRPNIPWDAEFGTTWQPGEPGTNARMDKFGDEILRGYSLSRDRPDRDGTSLLSAALHFGEVSPAQAWESAGFRARRARSDGIPQSTEVFQRELGWREFSYHVLLHHPHTPHAPLRQKFNDFPWIDDEEALAAWQRGRTGYPIVDAGMRQLWRIGWMHNRVRMVAASFLTKDLLVHWTHGAAWFLDTLIDADLASNTMGWQWAAGCGADAQPFFRIFNPVSQGEKFDPDGDYVRRWVPELAMLPTRWVHKPWEAPANVLENAGITLGETYPYPIVEHRDARERALNALREAAIDS